MMARRVFGKAESIGSSFEVSHSDQTCFELQWFIKRYPMVVEPRDFLNQSAAAHVDRIQTLDEMIDRDYVPRSFKLAVPARHYQQVAADSWLCGRQLLLADDVGLGKTASAIAAMTAKEVQPVLVATLANLPMQWKGEINKFAPDLYCHILKKGTPYELPKKNGRGPDVIISSYHKLVGWCDVLAEYCKSFVGDEIQELRHSSSQKYTAARRITSAVEYRIGLSATPIYNFGEEFYNIGQQLFPGALGTRDEFSREWLSGKRLKDPDAFGAWLRDQHLMLRRTRKDVGRELPALQKITVPVDSDEQALKQVEGRAGELARLIMNGGAGPRGAAMNAAGEFDSLMRQATGLAKAPYVAAFVEMLLEQGTPVVLFGWHHAVYEVWMQQLSRWNPRLYTGRQSNPQKQESFNAFVNGETNLLILSLRSGAGLDGLQRRCCTTVHGEFDWSPGVIEQDIGRVFRDGQENPVQAFMMLSDSGSDPLMAEVIGLKTNDIEGLRGRTRVLQRIDSGNTLRKLAEQYLRRHAAQGL